MDQDHQVGKYRLVIFTISLFLLLSCIETDKEQKSSQSVDSVAYKKYIAIKSSAEDKNLIQKEYIPELSGTTIVCTLSGNCEYTYVFVSESEYKYWDCELHKGTQGKYEIADSLLILNFKQIVGNIELREEFVKLTMIFSGDFFVLEKREVLEDKKWITTYERSKRTRAHGKECKYHFK